ncbi:DUF4440 domain-containing protein [Tsukamurella ocularis]|uniref:DUF4440 domain-containing protein n=1 Tax=Tsukamurella ocularis TaxID=1970234 RepID=UPI0039F0B8AC
MSDEAVVAATQKAFDDAELRDDRAVLEDLLHAEFLSIGPKGFLLDKGQWISRHEHFRYHTLDVDEMDVRLFGDAAIVRSVQRNHADSSGHDVRIATRVSQTWVRSGGGWQLAGIQFSPLADQ